MKNMQPEPNSNQGNKAMNEYINDISQQTAEHAFNGTSFSLNGAGKACGANMQMISPPSNPSWKNT